jgi:hypothetical protein
MKNYPSDHRAVKLGTVHCNTLLRYSAIGGNKKLSHYCNKYSENA